MKTKNIKFLTMLIIALVYLHISTLSFAQAPHKMSYQAVIRKSNNQLIANTIVNMRISILEDSVSGPLVYVETQTAATNINGLVTIQIGDGNVIVGNFSAINWAAGPYFLKTETDPTGGTSYNIIGSKQLISVPYALYAANGGGSGTIGATGINGATGAGSTGYTGSTGIIGFSGNTGSTGDIGNIGSTGYTGTTGLKGATGDIGATGVGTIGSTGRTGSTGSTGSIGIIGFTGSTGVTGNIGSTGSKGSSGSTGNIGSTGSIGSIGSTGTKGNTGTTGNIGKTGATGAGFTGSTGSTGDRYSTTSITSLTIIMSTQTFTVATGLAYSIGQEVIIANSPTEQMIGTITSYNSLTGVMVVTISSTTGTGTFTSWQVNLRGAPGPAGPIGTVGITGATGIDGNIGTTGGIGATGSIGYTGSVGNTGTMGATGNIGATGSGSTGATGVTEDRYSTTSITILTIAIGAQTFTVESGLAYSIGQDVIIANTYNQQMVGTITNYNSLSGVMNVAVSSTIGSGIFSAWQINLKGAPGPAGPAGAIGITGATGIIGFTGSTGLKGSTGITGATGDIGATGSNGKTGATGSTGSDGSIGNIGVTGSTGSKGNPGATGTNGTNGSNGATGSTGAIGTNGSNGATGSTGAIGTNGNNGSTGATGTNGSIGSTGSTGAIGTNGTNGATGATGTNGSNGSTGSTGAMGTNGSNGATGTNGSNGNIGSTGATGIGLAGSIGTTGSTGSQGYPCWDTNQNGINDPAEDVNHDGVWNVSDCNAGVAVPGPIGSTGATGTDGSKGNIGATGTAGTNGSNGNTGSTGAVGTNGNNGNTGTTGAAGTNGSNGNTGPTGAIGAIGPNGSIGTTGSTGTFPNGTSNGDMQYWNGTAWIMIPVGKPGQFLQLTSSKIPAWLGATYPTLTTTAASSIANDNAASGGNITDDGGADITVRGVCWSTSANPTTANSTTTDGTGTGTFTSSITGLTLGTTYYVRAYATNSAGTGYGNQISFTTVAVLATLTTTEISSITTTSAASGGEITNDGGAAITARGVCWNTSTNPTTANTKTTNGTGTGIFTSSITGLTFGKTYYVRAYATNSVGTAYGNEVSFQAGVGTSYQGGIIAYFLQSGDPGYIAGQTHGLIAAPSDQSTGIQWNDVGYSTTGATATILGTGNANTNTIVTNQGAGSYAAQLCADLVLGGHSDWYLPSQDELNLLYLNKIAIGGFADDYYWSSSEYDNTYALIQAFTDGTVYDDDKNASYHYVRAVRAF